VAYLVSPKQRKVHRAAAVTSCEALGGSNLGFGTTNLPGIFVFNTSLFVSIPTQPHSLMLITTKIEWLGLTTHALAVSFLQKLGNVSSLATIFNVT